jgi:hypothetical protein
MKNDKLQKLKILKRIILFTLALTLTNCQVDDDVTEQPQSAIKTVNIDEAKTFLKQSLNNTSAKLLGSETVNLKLDKITQEKINGSDQLLTVIPVLTNDKKEYSRILISRIGGVLRAVVFSMYSDKDNITEKFSGKIMIRNLNGDFLNGYRVENGIYVSQFQKTTKNITKREGGEETPSSGEIPLNEVVITNSYRRPNAATPWLYLYNDLDDSGGGFGNYSWDSGNGGGSGGGEGTSPPTTSDNDPCNIAKTMTSEATSFGYTSARESIIRASADGLEHSITLGRDSNNIINQAPMNNGGTNAVKTNTTWPGAFAAIHNHPNNTPLSSGDIYASVILNTNNSNFTTSYIMTDGETYAIVVTDLAAAQAFTAAYPADTSLDYPPEFPTFIFDQIEELKDNLGYSIEGRTKAIATILSKYNTGITLLKKDNSGGFNPLIIKETTQSNGTKTYTEVPCN